MEPNNRWWWRWWWCNIRHLNLPTSIIFTASKRAAQHNGTSMHECRVNEWLTDRLTASRLGSWYKTIDDNILFPKINSSNSFKRTSWEETILVYYYSLRCVCCLLLWIIVSVSTNHSMPPYTQKLASHPKAAFVSSLVFVEEVCVPKSAPFLQLDGAFHEIMTRQPELILLWWLICRIDM